MPAPAKAAQAPDLSDPTVLEATVDAATDIIMDLLQGKTQLRPDLQAVADDYLLTGARLGTLTEVQKQAWLRRGLNRNQRRALQAHMKKANHRG